MNQNWSNNTIIIEDLVQDHHYDQDWVWLLTETPTYIRSVAGREGKHKVKEVQPVLRSHHNQVSECLHTNLCPLLQCTQIRMCIKLYFKINRTSSLNNKVHWQKCLQEFMNETNWRAGRRYLLLRSSICESSAWHCQWWPGLAGLVAETAWNKTITIIITLAWQLSSCITAYHLWWQIVWRPAGLFRHWFVTQWRTQTMLFVKVCILPASPIANIYVEWALYYIKVPLSCCLPGQITLPSCLFEG